jgi:hypothetical protein
MTRPTQLRNLARLALACVLATSAGKASASVGVAQPVQPQPEQNKNARRKGSGAHMPGSHAPELRSETFRLMDAYVISNLQESIGLSDEQFAKVLPIVKKLQSDRRDCAVRRMTALRSLRKTLQSGTATEGGVAEILKDVKGAVADERAATVSNLEALDALLTPLQQAKYRVFEAEVDVRLRHLLARTQDRERPSRR